MSEALLNLRTIARERDGLVPIIQTLAGTGRFQTLITTLAATGLSQALLAPGPRTLFAPSDYAFERLPVETVRQFLNHPGLLRSVLQAHITDGEFCERDLIPFTRLRSHAGSEIHLSLTDQGEALVNGVPVLTADILATNGVIHELDGVLLAD
jgi:uncharacterized surface protein with fasciclin (FAS1) repeats